MAVTRIKNNQITDQTIEYTKIKPYTLVGTLFNPELTINSNIAIIGNLSVTGNTQTVNSVNTLINDPLVIFNNGYTGTPSYDVGILVNRNLNPINAAWVWREANVGFAGVLTSETGTTAGAINNTTYANLTIGNTIIDAYSVNSVNVDSGAFQVRGGAGVSANLNVGGTSSTFGVSTGLAEIDGNVPIVQISQLSSTRYGLMVTDTNNNGAMALRTSTAKGSELHTFGGTNNDIYIQPNRLKSIWLPAANASILADNNLNSTSPNIGAIVVTGSGGIGIGGNLNVGTSASFETGRIYLQAPPTATNAIAISNGTLYTGIGQNSTVVGTGIGATSVGARSTIVGTQAGSDAPGADSTLVGFEAGQIVSGTNNQFFGTGAGKTITTGNYNVILGSNDGTGIRGTADNNVLVADGQGNMRVSVDTTGNVYVWASLNSFNSNTGALVVQGGVGIGANLNVGGALSVASGRVVLDASTTSLVLAGNTATTYISGTGVTVVGQEIGSAGPETFGTGTTVFGYQAFNTASTAAQNTLIGYRAGYSGPGAYTTAIGSQAGLNLADTALNNQLFGHNAGSQITTGSYNVVLGANTMSGLETVDNYIMLSDGQGNGRIQVDNTGVTTIYATTQSESPADGALVVYGGVGIGGNLHVGDNVTVLGNLTVLGTEFVVDVENLVVNDSIIDLHSFANLAPLTVDDGRDIGIRFNYYKDSDKDAFLGWSNDNSFLEYYVLGTETNGVFSGTLGTIKMGELWATNTTASTSQTTGALRVDGGAGIGGRLTANNAVIDNNLTASGTDAIVTFSPTGAGYVTINPSTEGTINTMSIGQTTPANGTFTNLVVSGSTTPAGINTTLSGSGYVYIQPTGTVIVNPTATGNMDNVYIGNTTPRQATFTAATVQYDFNLTSFTANSALFISPSGNLAVDQRNEQFNFQRLTGNTYSTTSLSLGHATQNDLLVQGTDTLNIRYQADSYLAQSDTVANTVSRTMGWTTSTSRGTPTTPEVTQDGDFNGIYSAYAYTGATPGYKEIAGMRYVNQGTTAATNGIGGQAQLWTKRDDGDLTLALRVDANQIATFTGQVAIANTTTTTSSTTGAFYVAGGTGIGGNIVVAQSARFNDLQNAGRDFYVRGDKDATLIWASTDTYNQVLIGNSAISANLVTGAKLQINSTDSILLPSGTSAQRPGGAAGYGSAVAGMVRFNTINGDLEYYTGTTWFSPQTSALTLVTDDQYAGDGVETVFSLTRAATTNGTFVTLNGVVQHPSVAYNVAGDVLTFTEAPAIGDAIDIRTVTLTTEVIGLSAPLGYVTAVAENDSFKITTGATSANLRIQVLNNSATVSYHPANVVVGTTPVAIDSFDAAVYRSAKYHITVQRGSDFETSEVMVLHDGTTSYRTQYNKIYSNVSLGSVTTTYSSGSVLVYFTGISSGQYVLRKAEYIAI